MGVRAIPARYRARYERTRRTKSATESARPLIHAEGRGNASATAGAAAIDMAESSDANAALMTSAAPLSGGTTSSGTAGVTMAAESYASARLPSDTPLAKKANDRARALRAADPSVRLAATSRSSPMTTLAAVRLFRERPLKSRSRCGAPKSLCVFNTAVRGSAPRTDDGAYCCVKFSNDMFCRC